MGSAGDSSEELTVLVTGFGPFKEHYPVNPSWEIASSLPDYVPPDRVKDPARQSGPSARRVRIITPPKAIRVNYEVVRAAVPELWDAPPTKIDFVVHIGMAGPQSVYQIERRGHREPYHLADVDGRLLEDERPGMKQRQDWVWHDTPKELLTDLDVEAIYARWVERSPKLDGTEMRISEDAGHYLCDFIYYSSLAHLYKQAKRRRVIFLHVPALSDQRTLDLGKELALQLIRSIAETEFGSEPRPE